MMKIQISLLTFILSFSVSQAQINWTEVSLPDDFSINSFFINGDGYLYIGSNGSSSISNSIFLSTNQGLTWNQVGSIDGYIGFIGQNSFGELIAGRYSKIYKYEIGVWKEVFQSTTGNCYNFYGQDSLLFVGNGGVIRSTNDGNQWELVLDFPGSVEDVKGFTATSNDSILLGTTNWIGNGGGIYLSTNSGQTWEEFGLEQHFIRTIAADNEDIIYAGNGGHYETGQGGLYRYNYQSNNWDTIIYYPYINSIVFTSENHIYLGYELSVMVDWGGVMHSEDNGNTWVVDTAGMGSTWVTDLQLAEDGTLYALTGYSTKKLYRTTTPVSIEEHIEVKFPTPKLIKLIDLSGKEITEPKTGVPYIEVYDNGSTRKRMDVR